MSIYQGQNTITRRSQDNKLNESFENSNIEERQRNPLASATTFLLVTIKYPTSSLIFKTECCRWIRSWTIGTWIRIVLIILFIGIIVTLIALFPERVKQFFIETLNWIQEHQVLGSIVFIGIYVVATVLCLPGSLLTLGAGFVFKLLWGFCVVWLGATIGTMIIHIAISENIRLFQITDAQTYHQLNNGEIILKRGSGLTLAFFLGRTALRGWVEKQAQKYPKFRAVDSAIGQKGGIIVLLVRLTPIIPFNLLNYTLALTKIKWWQYIIASAIGIIPGTLLYTYLGSVAGDLSDIIRGQAATLSLTTQIIVWVISGVIILTTVIILTVIAKRAINKMVTEQNAAQESNSESNILETEEHRPFLRET